MRRSFLILIYFIFLNISKATSQTLDVVNTYDIKNHPNYEKFIEISPSGEKVLKQNYTFLDAILFTEMKYYSDSTLIQGYWIEPKKPGRYPVIIYNRGGNRNYAAVRPWFMADFLGKIASEGYIVIGSQYRGALESDGQDEFGGKDVHDVLNLFPIISTLDKANSEKIGLLGWSRGSMMNYLTLLKTPPNKIASVLSIAGASDLLAEDRPEMYSLFRKSIPDYGKDSIHALKNRSIIYQVDNLPHSTAYFLIHGQNDFRVKMSQTINLFDKMIEKNYSTRLLIFENEGHGLTGVKEELMEHILTWHNKYLK